MLAMHARIIIAMCALAACVHDTVTDEDVAEARKHKDAGTTADAPPPPPPPPPSSDGIVSCYTEGNPGATCTLPVHCCFTNYSSQHNGECTTSACFWGTIACDGPEDCPAGQHCCGHALIDPALGLTGWSLACQADACGAPPANEELCHADGPGCSCTSAYLTNNDLPRTLSICR